MDRKIGSGYGSGSGSGDGSVSGDGDGSGSGSGDGSGSGYGYGSGYGDGSGDGSGSGSGSGYGYGELFQEYADLLLFEYAGARGAELVEQGCVLAFWKSKADGTPANGGSGGARKAGMIEEIKGPLRLCGPGALHATQSLNNWSGERIWVVALYPPIAVQPDKIGSLKREIICEFPNFTKAF